MVAQDWVPGRGADWIGGYPESWWCSTRNPQPGCTARHPDICEPVGPDVLVPTQGQSDAVDVIKSIQRWANAFLGQAGKRLLYVDARVGPSTVQAVNAILGTMAFVDCNDLMASASWVARELAHIATNRGLTPPPDPELKIEPTLTPRSKKGMFVVGIVVILTGIGIFATWQAVKK